MVIIKISTRNLLISIVISVFLATLIISFTIYSKSKETQAFYSKTYTKAFEQTKITSELIENVLENKSNITSQEVAYRLIDIHNSLNTTAENFELISSRFLSNKPNTNNNFMRDLILLYSDEMARLQSELSKNISPDDFDDIKRILFIRLALMNSDLQKIIALDTPHIANYTYNQISQAWVKLVSSLGYREVTKVYKLKYSTLFAKEYFFNYKK